MEQPSSFAFEEQRLWIAEMTISRIRYEAWLRCKASVAPPEAAREKTHLESVRARSRKLIRHAHELVAESKALRKARRGALDG